MPLPPPFAAASNWTDMSVQEALRTYALAGVPAGLLLGLLLGLVARREDGWGGYASFPRRAARLGHVAAVMLPALAGLYAVLLGSGGDGRSDAACAESVCAAWGAGLWIAGGVLLPASLFVVARRPALAPAVSVPALVVTAGAVCLAVAGLSGGAS